VAKLTFYAEIFATCMAKYAIICGKTKTKKNAGTWKKYYLHQNAIAFL